MMATDELLIGTKAWQAAQMNPVGGEMAIDTDRPPTGLQDPQQQELLISGTTTGRLS